MYYYLRLNWIKIGDLNNKKLKISKVVLTGMLSFSFAPPISGPFWKFFGNTFLPNLCSLSLFQEMPFLFIFNGLFFRVKWYVSLNKLQAIRPQGTMGWPLISLFSGLHSSVSCSLSASLSCPSFRLLTYLNRK